MYGWCNCCFKYNIYKRWINIIKHQTFYNWVWFAWFSLYALRCTRHVQSSSDVFIISLLADCNINYTTCCASSSRSVTSNSFVKCLTFGDVGLACANAAFKTPILSSVHWSSVGANYSGCNRHRTTMYEVNLKVCSNLTSHSTCNAWHL